MCIRDSPWEHPPQRASVEEALDDIYESMMQEKNMKRMFTLLRMGIPVEALVKVITFSGFIEGKYTVDVAKLLEPIVAMMITGEATLAEIPAKINLGDVEDTDFFKEMSERKYDMKLDEKAKEEEMNMGMEKPTDINVAGLMARGE